MSKPSTPVVRPMMEADVPAAATVSAEAFRFDISAPSARLRWEDRLRHSLVIDAGGSFVAERAEAVVGVAQAVLRDRIWILSLLTVSPSAGRGGEGRALLDATLDYGADRAQGGLIVASNDARAMRLYASGGFRIEPTLEAVGRLDPTLVPEPDPRIVRVERAELGGLDPISRAARGAAHTPDLQVAYDMGGSVLALEDRGWVAITPGHSVWALAALDEATATTLLWGALHHAQGDRPVGRDGAASATETAIRFITGRQQWAVQALVGARLPFTAYGALCHRGQVGPLQPYIPSPSFA